MTERQQGTIVVWSRETEVLDATPTPHGVAQMVTVLEARHGALAVDIAEFFATRHSLGGDVSRAWAWTNVAQRIRKREVDRVTSPGAQ